MATPGGQGMPYGGPFTRPPYLVPPMPESASKAPQGAPGVPRGAPAPHFMPYSPSLSHGDSAHVGKEGPSQHYYQGSPGNLPPPPMALPKPQPKQQPKQQPNGPLPPAVNGSWTAYPSQANGPTQKPPQLQVPSGAGGIAGHAPLPPPPGPGTLPLPGATTVPSRISQGYHHQQQAGSSPLATPNVSEPTSTKSSRNASPIPTQRYDFMEGQFSSPRPSPVNQGPPNANSHPPIRGPLPPTAFRPPIPGASVSGPPVTGPPVVGPYASGAPPMGPHQTGPLPSVPQHFSGPPLPSAGPPPPSAGPPQPSAGPPPPSGAPVSSAPPPSSVQGSRGVPTLPPPPMAPGFGPPVSSASAYPGYGPPPGPPPSGGPGLRYPLGPPPTQGPPPTSSSSSPYGGYQGRPSYPQQLGYSQQGPPPPQSMGHPQQDTAAGVAPPPLYNTQSQPSLEPPPGGVTGYDAELHSRMTGMSINGSFNKLWGYEPCNLLHDRNILPKAPEEAPRPTLPGEGANCSPEIFRCTLTKIPETQSLLQKARLPLGILIHPFRDVDHLPVIQSSTIVRCRSCRTYINPYVQFVERQKWKCNICFRINALPEDFMFDPSSRKYGDPERRPEVRSATVEFIAPSEYMLRPPQPAVYLFVLDVSHGAIQTGYLSCFCKVLLEELDNIPGDSRAQVGFITFDSSVHFYNLGEGLSQPQMLLVSDIEDVFLPSPDSLLVNINECRGLVQELLTNLPTIHAQNNEPTSALGAAVQAAYKLMTPVGGRVSVFQTCLPNLGPGSLKPREDPNQRAGKEIANLLPAIDFYKKLALDCSGQQVAVDLFLMGAQYMDIASLACISKYSAGCINYYPGLHSTLNKGQMEKFEAELRYYVTRKIGFEAVMRIRCTKGLMIHTFHGNFFVRSTDLLSLPNVNPDAGFGMQIAIEESLTDCNLACFQAAVLYTSSRGERRIRVHTLSLPVTALLQDILGSIDQEAVVGLLCKMAVDRSLSSSVVDARDALVNACLDLVQSFRATLSAGQASAGLPIPHCARLVPLFVLALMKHTAFRVGVSTKLDDRVFAMEQMKSMPLSYLMTYIYPALYPVHMLDDQNALTLEDGTVVSQPPRLQLSFEKIDRHGCYLLDTVERLYLYVGRAVSDRFCINVLGAANFSSVPDDMTELPELSTPESERVRNFVAWNLSRRPYYSPLRVIRQDSKDRHLFVQHLVDDRTESALSYYEFLQHLKQQTSK
ncbi:unnamed protein product [Ixodes hexagonus]